MGLVRPEGTMSHHVYFMDTFQYERRDGRGQMSVKVTSLSFAACAEKQIVAQPNRKEHFRGCIAI